MERLSVSADPGLRGRAPVDEQRPPRAELEAGVADGFTICFVGDCIISRPISSFAARDQGFRGVLEVLRGADVVYGNLETTLFDARRFQGHPRAWEGDWALAAPVAVAGDLADMNVRLLGRANNHALDWGLEGLRATDDALDAAGLVHAGTGSNASAARAARYLETSRGRVGLTSVATTFAPFSDAIDPRGEAPGRPGVNGLRLSRSLVLPRELADSLRAVVRDMARDDDDPGSEPVGAGSAGARSLFGFDVTVGAVGDRSRNRYTPDPQQLLEVLRGIRLGKQHSDFLVSALHAHEAEDESHLAPAAEVVAQLGRSAIDHGADAFVTTGIHHLGAVEVYQGRPILRGLGNFIWSDIQQPVPDDLYTLHHELLADSFDVPANATDADFSAVLNALDYSHREVFESVIATCRYEAGRLVSFELHPLELGRGDPLTASGIPRLATGAQGAEIIARLAALSEPCGTRIEWTGSVGRVLLKEI